jgi:hypothetical protein
MSKKLIRNTIILLASFIVIIVIYTNSFKDIEQVCLKKKNTEYFLLNYVTKQNLKEIVKKHNKSYQLKDKEINRVYLLNPILRIPDPIFNNNINYQENGCNDIDIMDIYCEVRYRKLENGKVDVWFNFFE